VLHLHELEVESKMKGKIQEEQLSKEPEHLLQA
jgi:hypothetical protein